MQKAAVLIRNAERAREALQAGADLSLNGLQVQFLLVSPMVSPPDSCGIQDTGRTALAAAGLFTCHPVVAARDGFQYATLPQMAAMVKAADVVIPF